MNKRKLEPVITVVDSDNTMHFDNLMEAPHIVFLVVDKIFKDDEILKIKFDIEKANLSIVLFDGICICEYSIHSYNYDKMLDMLNYHMEVLA